MNIKFTGWKAIVVIIAFAGFAMFRLSSQNQALATEGVEEIRRWLYLESVRGVFDDGQTVGDMTALAQNNFNILSVTRHGVSNQIVAKVVYRKPGSAHQKQYVTCEWNIPWLPAGGLVVIRRR